LQRDLDPVSPLNRAKSGKIGRFKASRFESLYQPYFGFWLFVWSGCGRARPDILFFCEKRFQDNPYGLWLTASGYGAKGPQLAARPNEVAENIPGTHITRYYLRRHFRAPP